MALTFGFYNSLNHDRKYNAEQFGSIFDGVIRDGVYMAIGGKLMVKTANNGMQVNIDTGRAWFNHTWTLNDTIYPITLPNAEPLLSKYVAVVLEVNKEEAVRTNSFKVVSGTPASNPQWPALINSGQVHQYALAYVLIKPAVTTITQADIFNNVGTSRCPFVTGVVQSMNIDSLIAQWSDQWSRWINYVNSDYRDTKNDYNSWYGTTKTNYNTWFDETKSQWSSYINDKTSEFDTFLDNQLDRIDDMIAASGVRVEEILDDCSEQFSTLFSNMQAEAQQYFDDSTAAWDNWFQHYQDELSDSQAAHLQAQIDAISFIYVINETLFLPNTGASVQNERVTFTIGNNA